MTSWKTSGCVTGFGKVTLMVLSTKTTNCFSFFLFFFLNPNKGMYMRLPISWNSASKAKKLVYPSRPSSVNFLKKTRTSYWQCQETRTGLSLRSCNSLDMTNSVTVYQLNLIDYVYQLHIQQNRSQICTWQGQKLSSIKSPTVLLLPKFHEEIVSSKQFYPCQCS